MNARLLISLACSNNCELCCNKQKENYSRFVTIDELESVDWGKYEAVCISGGEPLEHLETLKSTLDYFKSNYPSLKLYLYTSTHSEEFLQYYMRFDGINFGVHSLIIECELSRILGFLSSRRISLRVKIEESVYNKMSGKCLGCLEVDADIICFTMTKSCPAPEQDIYVLKGEC